MSKPISDADMAVSRWKLVVALVMQGYLTTVEPTDQQIHEALIFDVLCPAVGGNDGIAAALRILGVPADA